jgi:hypothetical protein
LYTSEAYLKLPQRERERERERVFIFTSSDIMYNNSPNTIN